MKRILHVLVSVAVALGILGAAEAVLRLAGFEREAAPLSLRFGYPNPREIVGVFRADPRLFWRLRPGSVFDAEAPVPINAAGYRGPVPAAERPTGLVRVAVMGDSVAFGAGSAWPEILERRLAERLAPHPVEVLNFGVPGYSVVQGLRQFEDDVASLRPDVVVIAYGWNDHWLARGGLPDAERVVPGRARATLELWLARLRLTQAIHAALPRPSPAPVPAGSGAPRRVPADVYEATVRRLVASARSTGAAVLVVGLPSGLREDAVPGYLLDDGFTPSGEDAVHDHALYIERARAAARAEGAVFVEPPAGFGPEGFLRDRIHFDDDGHARFAAALDGPVADAVR